jgi:hypothetical protein
MANSKGYAKNLKPAKKGEIRNPKGRPKKLVSILNDELKKEGFVCVTNTEVIDCLKILINLPFSRLQEIASKANDEYPMLYKKMAFSLINPKDNQTLDKLLDRVFGKATQDITSGGKPLPASEAQIVILPIESLKMEPNEPEM